MGQLSKIKEINVSETSLQLAAQAWCQLETSEKTMDINMAIGVARVIDPLLDHLYNAWTIITNAGGGDWNQESKEWTKAANRWRNEWHNILDAKLPKKVRTKKHAKNITNK